MWAKEINVTTDIELTVLNVVRVSVFLMAEVLEKENSTSLFGVRLCYYTQ